MKMYQIEVDEEIYNYLKKNAEPFKDTPNSVLHKLLYVETNQNQHSFNRQNEELPSFSNIIPSALAQILQMIILVKNKGVNRIEATRQIALIRNISTQAVIDKYTRQLGKRAYQIDNLLIASNLIEFKNLLNERFPDHKDTIEKVFTSIIQQ